MSELLRAEKLSGACAGLCSKLCWGEDCEAARTSARDPLDRGLNRWDMFMGNDGELRMLDGCRAVLPAIALGLGKPARLSGDCH